MTAREGKVAWKPEEIGGRRGGSEVYRAEEIELRAGDRIRWTRNDAGSRPGQQPHGGRARGRERPGDVPPGGRQDARTGPGRPAAAPSRPRLGLDRARLPGPHGRQCHRGDGGKASSTSPPRRASTSRSAGPATGPSWSPTTRTELKRPAPGRHRRAHRGARRHRRDEARRAGTGRCEAARDRSMRPERGPGRGHEERRATASKIAGKDAGAADARPRQRRHGPWHCDGNGRCRAVSRKRTEEMRVPCAGVTGGEDMARCGGKDV